MTDTTNDAPAVTAAPRRRKRWLTWLAIFAAIVGIAFFFAPRPDRGLPLDPSSPKPAGTKALVETLRLLGANVTIDSEPPGAEVDVTLMLVDTLSDPHREALESWVGDGGTLVLTDPASPLSRAEAVGGAGISFLDPELHRQCRVPPLDEVDTVHASDATLMKVPAGATGCFNRGDDSWLVIDEVGLGTVVTIGGPAFLTNGPLDEADNAPLAAALLAPREGARVSMLRPPPPGGGREQLLDLVPARVTLALVQLGIAFLIVVLWRGRRLGRPVVEAQPVDLAGSELVVAVGNLMQRAKGRTQAAAILREDLRRTLCERLGLPLDMPVDAVAESAAARTGLRSEDVLVALTGGVPRDEAELVALAQSIESIRQEVTSVRGSATPPDAVEEVVST